MSYFNIYLPSNVQDPSGQNKVGNYVTYLPQQLNLNGDWEAAVSEIFFTKSWLNVNMEQVYLYIGPVEHKSFFEYMTPGNYKSIKDLLNEINRILNKLTKNSELIKYYDKYAPTLELDDEGHVVMNPGKANNYMIWPALSDNLMNLLGFRRDIVSKLTGEKGEGIKESMRAEFKHDLSQSLNSFYLCCDIVKSSIVGDSFAQFLRIVKIPKGEINELFNIVYDHPIYYPIEKKEINSIEIDLQDETGETINFEGGFVIVGLTLREK